MRCGRCVFGTFLLWIYYEGCLWCLWTGRWDNKKDVKNVRNSEVSVSGIPSAVSAGVLEEWMPQIVSTKLEASLFLDSGDSMNRMYEYRYIYIYIYIVFILYCIFLLDLYIDFGMNQSKSKEAASSVSPSYTFHGWNWKPRILGNSPYIRFQHWKGMNLLIISSSSFRASQQEFHTFFSMSVPRCFEPAGSLQPSRVRWPWINTLRWRVQSPNEDGRFDG